MLKRASASRPSGDWSDNDCDMLADGALVGRIFKVHAAPDHEGSHADTRLCRDARGGRQELAARIVEFKSIGYDDLAEMDQAGS
jgi:hypothetical protein